MIGYTRDMTWAHPRTPLVAPPQPAGRELTSSAAAPTPPEQPDVWYAPASPSVATPPTAPPPSSPPVGPPSPLRTPQRPDRDLPPPRPPAVSSPAASSAGMPPIPQHVFRELRHSGRCGCRGALEARAGLSARERASNRRSRGRLSVTTLGVYRRWAALH